MSDIRNALAQRSRQIIHNIHDSVIEKGGDIEKGGNGSGKYEHKGKPKYGDNKDAFWHHRMMAGYHQVMGKQHEGKSMDFASSSDEEVRKEGKGFGKQQSEHEDLAEKHLKMARSLHKPETYGEWNNTVPNEKEAKEWGEAHDKKITEKKKDEDSAVSEKIRPLAQHDKVHNDELAAVRYMDSNDKREDHTHLVEHEGVFIATNKNRADKFIKQGGKAVDIQ